MKNLLVLLCVIISFVSCGSDDNSGDVMEDNRIAIEAYLQENNLVSESTSSGLYYIVDTEGNGTFPTSTSSVTVTYRGYNLEGQQFDASTTPITFPLQNLIPGWQEGIPKFSVGGSGILLVPSHLAYGAQGPSFNQPIVFDIALLGIQ